MVKLSVNVNKVAVVRNSRGGSVPSVLDAVEACLRAGAKGITVHPRHDQRHITSADVREIARVLEPFRREVELNIEGDPKPEWMELVCSVRPHQATLVPVRPGELTSEAGWDVSTDGSEMKERIRQLQACSIRVSLFVDAEKEPIRWAKKMGADRIELYTGPYASEFLRGADRAAKSYARYERSAGLAHELGLGINAGHDLDLDNLRVFRWLPHLDEVSIGHALISRAIFVGLRKVVREYLKLLAER